MLPSIILGKINEVDRSWNNHRYRNSAWNNDWSGPGNYFCRKVDCIQRTCNRRDCPMTGVRNRVRNKARLSVSCAHALLSK
jgi:hypothetical protein